MSTFCEFCGSGDLCVICGRDERPKLARKFGCTVVKGLRDPDDRPIVVTVRGEYDTLNMVGEAMLDGVKSFTRYLDVK